MLRTSNQVLVADLPALARYDAELWTRRRYQIATEGEVSLILIGGKPQRARVQPRVAIRLQAPLLEDVIQLAQSGSDLKAERYTYLARVTSPSTQPRRLPSPR